MDNMENMVKEQYLVAFDFDGVIWNSVDECFYIGHKVFRDMEGEFSTPQEDLLEKFRQGRYIAKDGEDFGILFYILKENPQINFDSYPFSDFYALRTKLSSQIKDFAVKFYQERERMKKEEFDLWLSWQGPIPGVIQQLPLVREKFLDLAISSTKDVKTIELLLSKYKQSYKVYGREHSTYKPNHIIAFSKEKGIPSENVIFIDDLLENLIQVSETGAICVMSRWGYNNPNQWKKAEEKGFATIAPQDIVGQLISIIRQMR